MEAEPERALVHRSATASVFELRRVAVPDELAVFVDHVWIVTWDLGEAVTESAVIPFPSVNLSVEWSQEGAWRHGFELPAVLAHGVVTRLFRIELTGTGGVIGVRFRPGGFAAVFGRDVSVLADRVLPAEEMVGAELAGELRAGISGGGDALSPSEVDAVGQAAIELLTRRAPEPSERFLRVAGICDEMRDDPELVRVDQLPARCGWSVRTIQRIFRTDVGAGPKWVLGRYRLQEAALELERTGAGDLAGLAATLGWYDQAHFTNEFRSVMGVTPKEYAEAVHRDPPATRPGSRRNV